MAKRLNLFDKAADRVEGERIGDVDIEFQQKEADTDTSTDKEFEKKEIMRLVRDYQKKDSSISKDLVGLVEYEQVWERAQELALDNKPGLKNFIETIVKADKSGEIQAIINSLTTVPEPQPEKPAEEAPKKIEQPKAELNDVMVYDYIERHPEFLDRLEKAKKNLKVPTVQVFFRQDDVSREHLLRYKDIKSNVILHFDGDLEKACSPTGWYTTEYRIADSDGNPTAAVYDKPSKG